MEEIIVSIMEMLMSWESILGLVLYIPVAILIGLLTLVIAVGPWIVLIIVLVRFGKSKKASKMMTALTKIPVVDGLIDMRVSEIIERALKVTDHAKHSPHEAQLQFEESAVSVTSDGVTCYQYVPFSKLGMKGLYDPVKLNDMCVSIGDQVKKRLQASKDMADWKVQSRMVSLGEFRYRLILTRPNPHFVPLQSWDGDLVRKINENIQSEDQQRLSQMQDRKHAEERKKKQEIQQQAIMQKKLDALRIRFEKSPYTETIAKAAIARIMPCVNDQLRRLTIQQKVLNITCTLRVCPNYVDFSEPVGDSHRNTFELFNLSKENLKPLSTDEELVVFKDCILDIMKRSLDDMVARGEIDQYDIEPYGNIKLTKKNPSYEPPKEW